MTDNNFNSNNSENFKEYIIVKNKLANLIGKTTDIESNLNDYYKRSIENSIIDIPLPNEKDSFSEYSLFVDKIFKKLLKNILFLYLNFIKNMKINNFLFFFYSALSNGE